MASSKDGEEKATPLVVNVESSREKAKVYTRRSRNPSHRDNVPRTDLPLVVSHEEQHDDVPPAHEAQSKPSELEDVEDHLDTKGEEFHEGDLHSAEVEIEKIMQSPMVAHADSPIRTKANESPPREVEAVKDPSPEQEEEHVEEEESKIDETPNEQNLNEEIAADQQEEMG